MNIRLKTLLVLLLVLTVLISTLYFVSQNIIMNGINAAENKDAEFNSQRFTRNLNIEFKAMNAIVSDWSSWDDTYRFVEDNNTEFQQTNLVDSTFENLNLNLMLFINQNYQIVYCEVFNLTNQSEMQLPQSTLGQGCFSARWCWD